MINRRDYFGNKASQCSSASHESTYARCYIRDSAGSYLFRIENHCDVTCDRQVVPCCDHYEPLYLRVVFSIYLRQICPIQVIPCCPIKIRLGSERDGQSMNLMYCAISGGALGLIVPAGLIWATRCKHHTKQDRLNSSKSLKLGTMAVPCIS
jgi:hypothetical protein